MAISPKQEFVSIWTGQKLRSFWITYNHFLNKPIKVMKNTFKTSKKNDQYIDEDGFLYTNGVLDASYDETDIVRARQRFNELCNEAKSESDKELVANDFKIALGITAVCSIIILMLTWIKG